MENNNFKLWTGMFYGNHCCSFEKKYCEYTKTENDALFSCNNILNVISAYD